MSSILFPRYSIQHPIRGRGGTNRPRIEKLHFNIVDDLGPQYIESRTMSQVIVDKFIHITEYIFMFFALIYNCCQQTIRIPINGISNNCLYIFIPGLHATSLMWVAFRKQIIKLHSTGGQDIPNVQLVQNKKNGNQSVMATMVPIFNCIHAHCLSGANKSVCIVGSSLGALIALMIEYKLRKCNILNPLAIVSVSGAFGSKVINTFRSIPVVRALIHENVAYNISDNNRSILWVIRHLRTMEHTNTQRIFYSGMNDTIVYPPSLCHPLISQNDMHFRVHAAGHTTVAPVIVNHLCQQLYNFSCNQS